MVKQQVSCYMWDMNDLVPGLVCNSHVNMLVTKHFFMTHTVIIALINKEIRNAVLLHRLPEGAVGPQPC